MQKNIRIMLALNFFQGMVFYSSIATLYRQAVGVSMFQIALIESISMALMLVLELPWGILADRIGYRRTMVVCSVLFFLSKIIFWQAESFGMFLLERVVMAVVLAGLSGVDESIIYLSCREEEAQKVFGRWSAAGSAGVMVSTVLYTLFVGENYRLAALLTVISYAVAAGLSFFLAEVRPQAHHHSSPWADFTACLHGLVTTPGLAALVVSGALWGECGHQVTVFLNQMQYQRCGWDVRLMGVAYALCTLAEMCSALSDKGARRLGERRFGLVLLLGSAAACLILALTQSGMASFGCIFFLCLAMALFGPLAAAMENRLITTPNRATALSVHSLVSSGAGMGVSLAMGRAADASLPGAFLLGALLCGAAAVLFLFMKGKRSR